MTRELHFAVADATFDRFRRNQDKAQDRMDRDELENPEFLLLLLDVWEYHLDESDRVKP